MYFKLIFSYFHILYDNIDTICIHLDISAICTYLQYVCWKSQDAREETRTDDLSSCFCVRYRKYSLSCSLSLVLSSLECWQLVVAVVVYAIEFHIHINFIAAAKRQGVSIENTWRNLNMLICILERLSGIYILYVHFCVQILSLNAHCVDALW